MAIEEILDDIKENVEENPDTQLLDDSKEETVEKKPTGEVIRSAFEHYLLKEEDLKNLALISSLAKSIDFISSIQKVNVSIANEVFTMIPEFMEKEKAKLTRHPSEMNRKILIKNFSEKLRESINEFLSKFFTVIEVTDEMKEKIISKANDIIDVLSEFKEKYEGKYEFLKKDGVVIRKIDGEMVSLLAYPFQDIIRLSTFNYDKLDNSNFKECVSEIFFSDYFSRYQVKLNTIDNLYRNLILSNIESLSSIKMNFLIKVNDLIKNYKIIATYSEYSEINNETYPILQNAIDEFIKLNNDVIETIRSVEEKYQWLVENNEILRIFGNILDSLYAALTD